MDLNTSSSNQPCSNPSVPLRHVESCTSTANTTQGTNTTTQSSTVSTTDQVAPSLSDSGCSHTSGPKKKARTKFTIIQLQTLRAMFAKNIYITTEERKRVSKEIGLSQTMIKTWFQNRRMKWKKENHCTVPGLIPTFTLDCIRNPLSAEAVEEALSNLTNTPPAPPPYPPITSEIPMSSSSSSHLPMSSNNVMSSPHLPMWSSTNSLMTPSTHSLMPPTISPPLTSQPTTRMTLSQPMTNYYSNGWFSSNSTVGNNDFRLSSVPLQPISLSNAPTYDISSTTSSLDLSVPEYPHQSTYNLNGDLMVLPPP